MPSQHTYCGSVWNLIQDCDVQSAEPEGDMLPSEPARRAPRGIMDFEYLLAATT